MPYGFLTTLLQPDVVLWMKSTYSLMGQDVLMDLREGFVQRELVVCLFLIQSGEPQASIMKDPGGDTSGGLIHREVLWIAVSSVETSTFEVSSVLLIARLWEILNSTSTH